MILYWFSSKIFFTFIILVVSALPLIHANDIHKLEKRQIGVLARTGALPSGKRSVEVLARNGELPPLIGGKKDSSTDQTLDLLIQELETAESLSQFKIQALTVKFLEEKEIEENTDLNKRSVSALARNGELPQKRLAEIITRAGYLIKLPQEIVQPTKDLLNPDDFLADDQSSKITKYLDGRTIRPARNFFLENGKRNLGSIRNFWLSKKGMDLGINPYSKQNIISSTQDSGFSTSTFPKEPQWDKDFFVDDKKNVGASKNFGKREISRNCLENSESDVIKGNSQKYLNKHLKTKMLKSNSKEINKRRKRNAYFEGFQDEYELPFLQNLNEIDYEDFPMQSFRNEEAQIEKRFLGRIPQLGRIHQKVQSPSARRRPHLRPNWL